MGGVRRRVAVVGMSYLVARLSKIDDMSDLEPEDARSRYAVLRICPRATAPEWWSAALKRHDMPAAITALMRGRTRVEVTAAEATLAIAWAGGIPGWATAEPKPAVHSSARLQSQRWTRGNAGEVVDLGRAAPPLPARRRKAKRRGLASAQQVADVAAVRELAGRQRAPRSATCASRRTHRSVAP